MSQIRDRADHRAVGADHLLLARAGRRLSALPRAGGRADRLVAEANRLAAQALDPHVDVNRVAEAQRRPVVALAAHRREADAPPVDEVEVGAGAEPGPEELLERQVKVVEEARV